MENDIFVAKRKLSMRYLILIIVFAFVFTACEKGNQTEPQHCYTCVRSDSVTTNIPGLVYPHYADSMQYGEDCQLTDAQMKFFEKTHTYSDTLSFIKDTLKINHLVMKCTVDY